MDTTTTKMNAVRLVVEVPVAVAVREGTGRAGRTTLVLSPEVLGALEPEERELLAASLRAESVATRSEAGSHELSLDGSSPARALVLPTSDTGPGAVTAALRTALGAELALRAELARQIASRPQVEQNPVEQPGKRWRIRFDSDAFKLQSRQKDHPALVALREELAAANREDVESWRRAFLATPAEALVQEDRYARPDRDRFTAPGLPDALQGDEAVRAHRRAVAEVAWAREEARRADEKARQEAQAAREEEARAEAARKAEADREAMLAYARAACAEAPESPWQDVLLLAEEGYDPMPKAADLILNRVAGAVAAVVPGHDLRTSVDGTASDNWSCEPRKGPRPESVRLARAVRGAVAALDLPARGVSVEVLPVQRVTEEEDEDTGRKGPAYTAVCVEIGVAGAPRRWVVVNAEA